MNSEKNQHLDDFFTFCSLFNGSNKYLNHRLNIFILILGITFFDKMSY